MVFELMSAMMTRFATSSVLTSGIVFGIVMESWSWSVTMFETRMTFVLGSGSTSGIQCLKAMWTELGLSSQKHLGRGLRRV